MTDRSPGVTCVACGREGRIRKTVVLEHVNPFVKDDRIRIGKCHLAMCDPCAARARATGRDFEARWQMFWRVVRLGLCLVVCATLFVVLAGASWVRWVAPLVVAAGLIAYEARRPRTLPLPDEALFDQKLDFVKSRWGLEEAPDQGERATSEPGIPVTPEAILGVLHPEIREKTGFRCDRCGKAVEEEGGFAWPLVACRVRRSEKVRGLWVYALSESSEPKTVVLDLCRQCVIGLPSPYMDYRDFYVQLTRIAATKAKPMYDIGAWAAVREAEFVTVCTEREHERLRSEVTVKDVEAFHRL
jgi:hypothetical protein